MRICIAQVQRLMKNGWQFEIGKSAREDFQMERHAHQHSTDIPHHHHTHGHEHSHAAHGHFQNHTNPEEERASRRDFLRVLMGGALAGASILELAYHRAAWARAAAAGSDSNLFDLQKAAEGVFFAQARPQAAINCNAAVFVRSKDVVVVDAHSKPSAAAALLAQLKREVTTKPVRYVINTHFHWDHTQGNPAYRAAGGKVDFISTAATKQLMSDLGPARTKASVEAVPKQVEALRKQAEKATSAEEKAFCAEQIRQLEAYAAELANYSLELPTITFDESYALPDSAFDLHLGFHGHAHTAGDVFVFCPQQRTIATGDACIGWIPNLGDGFPKAWPRTLDEVAKADFTQVLGGHGPVQTGRGVMTNLRNYIEELTDRVERAKEAGMSVTDMQQQIRVASLKSLDSNGYAAYLIKSMSVGLPHFKFPPPLEDGVNANIRDIYKNLDKV
jgi:glyoxylase-like metal-dependent hydrolase (beta-lactamase superfamily II)